MSLAVIILAAGKGTRMKSDLPKVLHKVAGKAMVTHVADVARSVKAEKIITIISAEGQKVANAAGTESAIQKNQLGTGDAVKSAAGALSGFDGKVLILSGDSPLVTTPTIQSFINSHIPGTISMLVFDAADPAKYGRLSTSGNEVKEIIEFKDASEDQKKITLCNSGIYLAERETLFRLLDKLDDKNAQKEFYLTDIVKLGAKEGIKTYYQLVDETEVSGVNDMSELARAEKIMQDRLRHNAMVNGVTMIAPETVFLSADTKFGKGVILKPNVVIGEEVVIEDGVTIGPFAHIRPGTVLRKNAKVGNFVETKKAIIGEGSKINHLSYVGDSELGADVNVGAGTITCNYDGYSKSKTTIEDGAFIGSNSALVAPVTIGKGAIVAAGSTITKDVPADSLGITRALQKNLAEWAAKFRSNKTKK